MHNKMVYITTFRNGSVLNIDLSYDSITQGPHFYLEFSIEIELKHKQSIVPVQNLFRIVANDARGEEPAPLILC